MFSFSGGRLKNITIDVYWNDPLKFVNEKPYLCDYFPGTVGRSVNLICPPDVRGRYVRVTLFANDPLTVCEVMVYGVAVSKPGIHGVCYKVWGGVNVATASP